MIVTGACRAFCAGMDLSREGSVFGLDERLKPSLSDLNDRYDDPAIVHGVRDTGGRVAMAIMACKKPVIAAINGPAVGIVPEARSTWLLPKLVGMSQALEWLYRADVFDAEEGRRASLIRSVVPADKPRAEVLARSFIDGKPAVSAALVRQMIYRNAGQPGSPILCSPTRSNPWVSSTRASLTARKAWRPFFEGALRVSW